MQTVVQFPYSSHDSTIENNLSASHMHTTYRDLIGMMNETKPNEQRQRMVSLC